MTSSEQSESGRTDRRTLHRAAVSFARLLLIGACFAVIFKKLNWTDILAPLRDMSVPLLLLAFLTVLAEPVIMALKWDLLLRQKGIHAGWFHLMRVIFATNFLGVLMPSSLGTEALRVYQLKRQNHDLIHVTGTLVADRLLAVLALCFLSLLAAPIAWTAIRDARVMLGIVVSSLGITIAIILLFSRSAGALLYRYATRMALRSGGGSVDRPKGFPGRIRYMAARTAVFVQKVYDSISGLAQVSRYSVTQVFVLNLLLQWIRVVKVDLLFRAIGIHVPFIYELAFVPTILMLTLMPISYFGLGIKEGAFIFFFSQVNVPPAAALTVSLLIYPLIIAAVLPGALFLLGNGWSGGSQAERDDRTSGAPPG